MTPLSRAICVLTTIAILLPAFPALFGDTAEAIPAFARKHRVSCITCHVAAPKLKPYGEEYAGNGFVLPDGEDSPRAYIDTGDESLLLQRDLPLAVRFDAYLRAGDTETADADLETPYGVKLLGGGRLSRYVSYYFYFYMDERGEVAGLEDAYLHFNDIAGSALDIMAGQFQVSDPLFKRELRLTFEDYRVYTTRIGDSRANLTYDRGLMLTYGFDIGLDLVGQVVNGNGIPDAENRIFDMDTQKAYSLRVSQSAGPVRVGGFGYYTEEEPTDGVTNELWYAGADATVGANTWEFNVQYLRREDDNPFFAASDSATTVTMDGGLAEFSVLPNGDRSRWIFTALYNLVDADGEVYDVETATVSVSHMAARNLRFLLEATYDIDEEDPIFTFGAMGAF
jgi:hypothetical protein